MKKSFSKQELEIIVKEEISKKDNLLLIAEKLATIRDKKRLFDTIYGELKSLFPFDFATVAFFDNEIGHSIRYPSDHHASISKSENYRLIMGTKIPVSGSPYSEFDRSRVPSIKTLEDLLTSYPNDIGVQLLKEFHYKESVYIPLHFEGALLAVFEMHSHRKGVFGASHMPSYVTVGHQLSVAIANILTNEAMEFQALKKSLELNLAKTLAQTATWESKLLEVGSMLQPFIGFQMLVINFEQNDNKCPTFAFLRTGLNEYQKLYKDDLLRITEMDGPTFTTIRNNLIKIYENPFILSGDSLLEISKNNAIKNKICHHFNFKSNLIYPLKLEKYGKIIFSFYSKQASNFTNEHIRFFESLENTLTLVFDRSLALEEIEKLNKQLAAENKYLQEEIKTEYNFNHIIGNSAIIRDVFKNIELLAPTDTTVLVLGETGTGKELIARSLHSSSPRKNHSLIKVNCATLPAQLIESELFGHEKGSFTGAFEKRIGKFELAHHGSIFLDEIGELPLELQAKLLRVIQEKEFERIGGKETIKCDVRIIAATNRILEDEVKKGTFRADLYYRLHVFPIHLPALRDRKEDIPILATHFAQKFSKKMNKRFMGLDSSMLTALLAYEWPGNIRELENVIEQAVIVNQHGENLQLARQLHLVERHSPKIQDIKIEKSVDGSKSLENIKQQKESYERQLIIEALQKTKGRVRGPKGAALILNILPTTLESKMKRYDIFKDEFNVL